jgi:hypothetical protein
MNKHSTILQITVFLFVMIFIIKNVIISSINQRIKDGINEKLQDLSFFEKIGAKIFPGKVQEAISTNKDYIKGKKCIRMVKGISNILLLVCLGVIVYEICWLYVTRK